MNHNRRFQIGLVLAGLLNLINVPSVLVPTADGETGPPFEVLVICSIFGLIGVVATVLAWRGNLVALRVAAGCLIVTAVASLPAFFVDVDAGVKLGTGAFVVANIVALVLLFGSSRERAGVPATN